MRREVEESEDGMRIRQKVNFRKSATSVSGNNDVQTVLLDVLDVKSTFL